MAAAANIIAYTDILEIKSELGLTQDSSGNYLLWQIGVDPEVLQHYVQQSNEQTTNKFGDLSSSAILFPLGKQYATKWASLQIVQTMTLNWQISGMRMQVGNLAIDRLEALTRAANMVIANLKEQIATLYNMLQDTSQISINSYQTKSPYVLSGGSFYWP